MNNQDILLDEADNADEYFGFFVHEQEQHLNQLTEQINHSALWEKTNNGRWFTAEHKLNSATEEYIDVAALYWLIYEYAQLVYLHAYGDDWKKAETAIMDCMVQYKKTAKICFTNFLKTRAPFGDTRNRIGIRQPDNAQKRRETIFRRFVNVQKDLGYERDSPLNDADLKKIADQMNDNYFAVNNGPKGAKQPRMTAEKLRRILIIIHNSNVLSLDAPLNQEEDSPYTLADTLEDKDQQVEMNANLADAQLAFGVLALCVNPEDQPRTSRQAVTRQYWRCFFSNSLLDYLKPTWQHVDDDATKNVGYQALIGIEATCIAASEKGYMDYLYGQHFLQALSLALMCENKLATQPNWTAVSKHLNASKSIVSYYRDQYKKEVLSQVKAIVQ